MKQFLLFCYFFFTCTVIFPTNAHAYIDPAAGSMILQTLGVAFIAISGAFVGFRGKISQLFRKRKSKDSGKNDPEDK